MGVEEIDPEKLAAGARRARAARHRGRPLRAHREAHPTALRTLFLLAALVAVALLAAVRVIALAH